MDGAVETIHADGRISIMRVVNGRALIEFVKSKCDECGAFFDSKLLHICSLEIDPDDLQMEILKVLRRIEAKLDA